MHGNNNKDRDDGAWTCQSLSIVCRCGFAVGGGGDCCGAFSDFFPHNFHISVMFYFDANIWTDGWMSHMGLVGFCPILVWLSTL